MLAANTPLLAMWKLGALLALFSKPGGDASHATNPLGASDDLSTRLHDLVILDKNAAEKCGQVATLPTNFSMESIYKVGYPSCEV